MNNPAETIKMIPMVDLQRQYASIKNEVDAAIQEALNKSQFILGEPVARFEEAFAGFCGTRYAVAVNSGTSALQLALIAAGVGPGDEVITVPFTFLATAASICYVGAAPVFVDIEPRSFNMDPSQIEKAITRKTKAIIPVHLYGQAAEMDPILAIAKKHGLRVIEDAAQAHGAEYQGKRVGVFGEMACFSFYPGKNLGAYGEGGAVVTNNESHAKKIRALRDWGQETRGTFKYRGFNMRMEGIQGAILDVKLKYLEKWNEARRKNARLYQSLLGGSDWQCPEELKDRKHVYHVFAIRSPERDKAQQALAEKGIQSAVHYSLPIHLTEAYGDLGYRAGDFPVSEQAARQVLSLPVFPELNEEEIKKVCSVLSHLS